MKTRAAILHEAALPRPYAQSRPISIEEIEFDSPGPGEVVVRIASAGLCHSDLSSIDGTIPKRFPVALGHEAAGIVEEIGAGVTAVKPGQHVVFSFVPICGKCAMCLNGKPQLCIAGHAANIAGEVLRGKTRFRLDGQPVYHHLGVSGFTERTVCAEESLVPLPDDVPLSIAAIFGCAALTGLGAVFNTARVEPGKTVAIFGAGGVGLMALLAAICAGATPIVVEPLAAKRALAHELGASLVVDPAVGDPGAQIRDRTGTRGVDYAFEATGRSTVVAQALAATAPGGTAIAIGLPHRDETVAVSPFELVQTERTLKGSFMGSAFPRRDVPKYVALWRSGRLPVERLISGTMQIEDLNTAFDCLADGEVVRSMCLFPVHAAA